MAEGPAALPDSRLHAYRPDLAEERLRGIVAVPRYVRGCEARVVAGLLPVRREPNGGAETLTFYQYGEPVLVFDEDDGHAWCRSLFDDYVGYVEARHVKRGPTPAPTHFVVTLGSYRYEDPDLRSRVIDFLPRHSAIVVAEPGFATRGTEYFRLDGGGYVPVACVSSKPPRSPDVATAASLHLGCAYLWGGRSFLGIDCSGLVQNAFRDLGIIVPRDTDMQREAIGAAVLASNVADLRRGDLLYPPGHVLIYAGEGRVIHADGASMTVRYEDLATWLQAHNELLSNLTVRRHSAAAGI